MELPLDYWFYLLLGLAGLMYLGISRFNQVDHRPPLPPGNYGWPIVGETLKLQSLNRSGNSYEFVKQRMMKHNHDIFKTSLLGGKTIVLCGAAANKLLFTAEKNLVLTYWPESLKKLFGDSFLTAPYDEAVQTRKVVTKFLQQEVLHELVERFDKVCKKRLQEDWIGNNQVLAFALIKKYSFSIGCEVFAGIEDYDYQAKLLEEFEILLNGVFQLPIYFPGTRHYKAVKSAGFIRRELMKAIEIKRSRKNLGVIVEADLITHLLDAQDEEGRLLTDKEIADNILLLMDAGHDTSSCTMMMLIKYLAETPDCYHQVLQEQREIALSKRPGELLNKKDILKMKYSWHVMKEVIRLTPPIQGNFRKAIVDFTYAGFSIPKGWKVWWSATSTHKDEKYFPEPEKFDPSRFERDTMTPYAFVGFGGGPRMCPGKEFARLEILVFLHNLVKEFSWELKFPDEIISVDPMPLSSKGLPIYLHPHTN